MAEQLWKGRFSKAVDSRVNDFNSSIRFDQRMIAQDMRGSGVHAAMLAKQGIISEKDCEDILSGLASIADDLASGALEIDPNAEDVHTFVEQTLTARIASEYYISYVNIRIKGSCYSCIDYAVNVKYIYHGLCTHGSIYLSHTTFNNHNILTFYCALIEVHAGFLYKLRLSHHLFKLDDLLFHGPDYA